MDSILITIDIEKMAKVSTEKYKDIYQNSSYVDTICVKCINCSSSANMYITLGGRLANGHEMKPLLANTVENYATTRYYYFTLTEGNGYNLIKGLTRFDIIYNLVKANGQQEKSCVCTHYETIREASDYTGNIIVAGDDLSSVVSDFNKQIENLQSNVSDITTRTANLEYDIVKVEGEVEYTGVTETEIANIKTWLKTNITSDDLLNIKGRIYEFVLKDSTDTSKWYTWLVELVDYNTDCVALSPRGEYCEFYYNDTASGDYVNLLTNLKLIDTLTSDEGYSGTIKATNVNASTETVNALTATTGNITTVDCQNINLKTDSLSVATDEEINEILDLIGGATLATTDAMTEEELNDVLEVFD